jgi:hypothetical protein
MYLLIKTADESLPKSPVWLTEGFDFIKRKWKGPSEDA